MHVLERSETTDGSASNLLLPLAVDSLVVLVSNSIRQGVILNVVLFGELFRDLRARLDTKDATYCEWLCECGQRSLSQV